MEQHSGVLILMIASGAGVLGGSSSVAYAASKGGYGFGLTLAGQPKPLNLRIHVVLPGNMDTPLKLNVIGEIAEKAGESREEAVKVQLSGLMKPEVTTELLANLASDVGIFAKDTLLIKSIEWTKIFENQKSPVWQTAHISKRFQASIFCSFLS